VRDHRARNRVWSSWPEAGVGIVCGPDVAVDIDIEEPKLPLELERLARARLGDTPALRIGSAPKRLLVYRAAVPFAGIRRAPIEVLGLGQQFVAHAIHLDALPLRVAGVEPRRHRHRRRAGR
jgi:hypothetical protein